MHGQVGSMWKRSPSVVVLENATEYCRLPCQRHVKLPSRGLGPPVSEPVAMLRSTGFAQQMIVLNAPKHKCKVWASFAAACCIYARTAAVPLVGVATNAV